MRIDRASTELQRGVKTRGSYTTRDKNGDFTTSVHRPLRSNILAGVFLYARSSSKAVL